MPVEQLIYTDRPRGGGLDPAASGYQIKAVSAGLADAPPLRDLLASICMHCGEAVYRYAPRAALDKETAWRAQTDNLNAVPAEVLDQFPVIWSYDRLGDDLYALTRVRYTGLTYDGRFGSFFAHAVAFAPELLAAHGSNPLALARTGLFKKDDSTPGTSLPQLPDLGKPAAGTVDLRLLTGGPLAPVLPALVSALCTATPASRPVVLCLPEWRQAPALVEALLGLLPPSARCRTTFSTYESDRTWVPTTRGGRPSGQAAAHHLLVLGGSDDRAFSLRADELQNTYAVFNFAGGQSSPQSAVRPYAAFAAECLVNGKVQRLQQYHELLERLGAGQDPAAWDRLLPAAGLYDEPARAEALGEAVACLAAFSAQPAQARAAQELVLPRVRALAKADDPATLGALAADLSALADRAPGDAGPGLPAGFLADLRRLARDALLAGRARTAAALLGCCGQGRTSALLAVLGDTLGKPATQPAAADRKPRVDLLLEGLALAEQGAPGAPPVPQVLAATFQAACEADLGGDVWRRGGGGKAVRSRLAGTWGKEQNELARELLRVLPVDRCPDGNAWLNLKMLEAAPPKGEELHARLQASAEACSRCGDAAKLVDEAVRVARGQLRDDPEAMAVALGRMAHAADGTDSGEALFTEYQDALKECASRKGQEGPSRKALRGVRQRLLKAGGYNALARELVDEVVPWDDEESPKRLREWREHFFETSAPFLDGVRRHVADQLRRPNPSRNLLPLAGELLPAEAGRAASPPPGLTALASAVALGLPLKPLSDRWARALACVPDDGSPSAARVRVLRFLADVKRRAADPNWSPATFPRTDPAWARDVRALGPVDQGDVIGWCLDTFADTGVTTPAEAAALVELLRAAGADDEERAADAMTRLLAGRDAVTQVVAAAAFARGVLEDDKPLRSWGGIVRGILQRSPKTTQRLFVEHMARRFGRRGPKYDERLDQLCEIAELPGALPVAGQPGRGPATRGKAADGSGGPSATGFLAGLLQRLWGGKKDDG